MLQMLGIYAALCISATQLLAPVLLLLCFSFLLKLRGLSETYLFPSLCVQPAIEGLKLLDPSTGIQVSLNNYTALLTLQIFTASFYKAVFSFLSWWTLFAWLSISLFALLSERRSYEVVTHRNKKHKE
jgi:hypothetical protein